VNRLLNAFRRTFHGVRYRHRVSTTGDRIAACLYDDLVELAQSEKLVSRVRSGSDVVNTRNRITGRDGRRGDGTFGQLVPGAVARNEDDYLVKRGPVAALRIGAEMKIIGTKQLAQIDRVMNDLRSQADTFRRTTRGALAVGIVGVNFVSSYTSYEGRRAYPAKYPPGRDAPEIVVRLERFVRSAYDELLILKFRATNQRPFPFDWLDEDEALMTYNSALARLSSEYDARF
jgi:hypothetical protein